MTHLADHEPEHIRQAGVAPGFEGLWFAVGPMGLEPGAGVWLAISVESVDHAESIDFCIDSCAAFKQGLGDGILAVGQSPRQERATHPKAIGVFSRIDELLHACSIACNHRCGEGWGRLGSTLSAPAHHEQQQ